jgi:DNA-binding MarR family transcriptional regulator
METFGMSNKQLKAWRAFIRLKNQLLPRLAQEITRNTALTPTDFYLLMALTDSADASLRSSEIAERLDWEKSRLSHQVSRMEERGLVSRSVCPMDARSSLVSLTSSGRKYVRQAIPGHFESIKHCFGDLLTAAQLDTLIEIGEIVTKHLAEEHQVGSTDELD